MRAAINEIDAAEGRGSLRTVQKATRPDRKKISTPDGQPFLPT
jgi:hypothetical protein